MLAPPPTGGLPLVFSAPPLDSLRSLFSGGGDAAKSSSSRLVFLLGEDKLRFGGDEFPREFSLSLAAATAAAAALPAASASRTA